MTKWAGNSRHFGASQPLQGCLALGEVKSDRPRILIISDVRLYREGLALSLSRRGMIAYLGTGGNVSAAIAQVEDLDPDILVLDVAMPGSLGLAKSVRTAAPAVRVIAFAVSEIDHEVLACAEAGIAGYVPRDASETDLAAAIENAMRGDLCLSPHMAGLVFRHVAALSSQCSATPDSSALTRREHQILKLIEQGMANKEIARELKISNPTVKNHVHRILEKLQVRRRGEAAACVRASRLWSSSKKPADTPEPIAATAVIEPKVDAGTWRQPLVVLISPET